MLDASSVRRSNLRMCKAVDNLSITAAQMDDVDALLPVVWAFYAHFDFAWDTERKRALLTSFLQRSEAGRLWLAKRDGRVLAYALVPFYFGLEFDGTVALLDEFFVLEECRGQGIGAALLNAVSSALQAEGIRTLRLEVDDRHPEATTLYERLGFLPDGRKTWSRRA